MKKFAIGCGIAVLLLAIAGGVAMWWAYSKAREYVGSMTQLTEVAKLDEQVVNQAPFEPPASGELTQAQVDGLVTVTRRMRELLGDRFTELDRKYRDLDARRRAQGRDANAVEMFTALRDLGSLVADVKRAQVTALNEQKMSLAEYRWVRDRAYAAAELNFVPFSLGAIAEAAEKGDTSALTAALGQSMKEAERPSEANRALVAPHLQLLRDTAVIAWLGL